MMFDKRKNVIAIASIAFLLAGCTDYAQEFRDEYGPGGNGSSEEISELDYDCSVSEGVRVLYPAQHGDRDFSFGDTITVVYGTDVRGSGYRFVFLDDGENQVDLLDKTVGPTAPDGKTCYTQKVVFDNDFFLEGTAGYIGVVPVEYPFLAGTSGLFKVYPRRSTNENNDCSVTDGVKVVSPAGGESFRIGDTVNVVFGSDLDFGGFIVELRFNEGTSRIMLLDESLEGVTDGITCNEKKIVLSAELGVVATEDAYIYIAPYSKQSKAGKSGTFKISEACKHQAFCFKRTDQTNKICDAGKNAAEIQNAKEIHDARVSQAKEAGVFQEEFEECWDL